MAEHVDLTLPQALTSLREQLEVAMREAQGEDLTLTCTTIEVQLQVTVTSEAKGSGKASLWSVVTVGGELSKATSDVHLVKLVLSPAYRGHPVDVSDED